MCMHLSAGVERSVFASSMDDAQWRMYSSYVLHTCPGTLYIFGSWLCPPGLGFLPDDDMSHLESRRNAHEVRPRVLSPLCGSSC